MNKCIRIAVPFFLLLVCVPSGNVTAQAKKPAPGAEQPAAIPLKIKKITGVGRQDIVRTPEFTSTAPRSAKQAGSWVQVEVAYDTFPEWLDEVTCQYYLITMLVEDGKKNYSLFKTSVKYRDVEKGKGHLGSVFLRPSGLKRFGTPVAVAVEISVDGKPVDEMGEATIQMAPKWWKALDTLDKQGVVLRDGYLLDRRETPFALVNVDDYEVSK